MRSIAAPTRGSGREVAIKVLPVATAGSPDALARFEREGRAIAALNHPNICTLFDVGTDAGQPYLVMELLAGATLHEVLAAGPLPIGTLSITRSRSPMHSTLRTRAASFTATSNRPTCS